MDKQTREAKEFVKNMSFSDRLKHFWYYNKTPVIIISVLVIAVIYSIYQIVTATKYDLEIVYYGERYFTEEQINAVEEYLSNIIEDVDGNSEKNVNFVPMTYSAANASDEYGIAVQQKFVADISAGTYSVYIVSPNFYEIIRPGSEFGITESAFELKESKVLNEILGEADDEYWCTRTLYESEKGKEKNNLLYKNAKLAEKTLFESE